MGRYPVKFKARWFSLVDEKMLWDEGIIYADNLKEAGKIIDNIYREDLDFCSFEFLEEGLYYFSKNKEDI